MNKKTESNSGGLFGGLGDLIEKLTELAGKGEDLKKTQEFSTNFNGKEMKGVYGFNVKFGIGNDKKADIKVEPFGNMKADKQKGVSIEEIREPMVDVIEEDDYFLILAEMPGVSAKDVKVEINDDILELSAESGERKYRKEILLSANCESKAKVKCNNGVVEIRCRKISS
jgi:HSP20 family protein